jgi:hypothetical protein
LNPEESAGSVTDSQTRRFSVSPAFLFAEIARFLCLTAAIPDAKLTKPVLFGFASPEGRSGARKTNACALL